MCIESFVFRVNMIPFFVEVLMQLFRCGCGRWFHLASRTWEMREPAGVTPGNVMQGVCGLEFRGESCDGFPPPSERELQAAREANLARAREAPRENGQVTKIGPKRPERKAG
jgi:hypothetical protein